MRVQVDQESKIRIYSIFDSFHINNIQMPHIHFDSFWVPESEVKNMLPPENLLETEMNRTWFQPMASGSSRSTLGV